MSERGGAGLERSERAGAGLSRRAVLAGAAAVCIAPPGSAAALSGDPVRIGVVAGLGLEDAAVGPAARALFAARAVLVPFGSWSALHDYAGAEGGGRVDAAVLPRSLLHTSATTHPVDFSVAEAVLLRRAAAGGHPAAALTVALALAHPAADAVIAAVLAGAGVALRTTVAMPADAMVANVAAGLVDAAVLVGDAARAAGRPGGSAGLRVTKLAPSLAADLLPQLALVRCGPGSPPSFARA